MRARKVALRERIDARFDHPLAEANA